VSNSVSVPINYLIPWNEVVPNATDVSAPARNGDALIQPRIASDRAAAIAVIRFALVFFLSHRSGIFASRGLVLVLLSACSSYGSRLVPRARALTNNQKEGGPC
jgi:hypothetical protein